MKPRVCEACQRPLPMDDIAAKLPPTKRRIYEAVAASGSRGLSSWEIMDKVYEDYADGGPVRVDRVKVNVCQMNRTLRAFGVRIRSSSGHYRLEAQGGGQP